MITLRYVAIDTTQLPPTPKCGTLFELDRALLLVLLDPQAKFYAVDLAYLHFPHGADVYKTHKRAFHNARRSYAQLGKLGTGNTNPELTGAEWCALLQAALRPVAALMANLKTAMEQHPGVIFAYNQGKLVPHPDQTISTAPFLPPVRKRKKQEPPSPRAVGVEPAITGLPAQKQALDQASSAAPLGKPKFWQGLPSYFWPLRYTQVVVLLVMMVLMPSAFGLYWYNLDEVNLTDIQEMGTPSGEDAYLIAAGKRYEIGDRLRFEGEVGVIQVIHREGLTVGDYGYPAPALKFFGVPLAIDGNFVVYPGSPRHIAGNFWLRDTSYLDEVPRGYLSWRGGWQFRPVRDLCQVMDFWAEVEGLDIRCTSDKTIGLPPDLQFDEFIEQCIQAGAEITQEDNRIEVYWP